jgi:uncharacterized alkaline shock family protein YloU
MSSRRRKDPRSFDLPPPATSPDGPPPEPYSPAHDGPGESSDAAVAQESPAGRIEVSPRAIAHLASRAAERCYGMVGFASRHARPGLAELLRREDVYKGVEVKFSEGQVLIELYVVIEYGTRISEVARNIMSNVKFAVESALGVPVVQVNVNVQDIRVSEHEQ